MDQHQFEVRGQPRSLEMGERLLQAGQAGPVWRVNKGVFRLERPTQDGMGFVQLALPGDLIGAEVLCAEPYSFSASAVVDSEASELDICTEEARQQVLTAALLQQQLRAVDSVRLRSGSVASRVDHFLWALVLANGAITQQVRDSDLPYLRDIASIVDSAPESVCRVLGRLVAPRSRGRTPRKPRLSPAT